MPGAMIETESRFAPLLAERGIGLAVSGGPDSLGLMLLVADWHRRQINPPPVTVYSVDHRLRPEAADEVAFVCREAERLDFAAHPLRWDGPAPDTGVQAAARQARYRLMAEAMAADGASILLTAHHRDDQAETVLMRLAHGSGIEGLRGMDALAEVEGCRVFRPLLDCDRSYLAAIVAAAGLTPAMDPSNTDTSYERVRWRQALTALAPLGLDAQRLGAFARRMDEVDSWLDAETAAAEARLIAPDGQGERIAQPGFLALPRPVAVRLLRRSLDRVGGGRRPHALTALETLAERITGAALKRTTLHGCIISADREFIRIGPEGPRRAGTRHLAGNSVP